MKVQAESFHLNGHIIGFRLQTQKLDSPYKTPSNTLAVKGLICLDATMDNRISMRTFACKVRGKQCPRMCSTTSISNRTIWDCFAERIVTQIPEEERRK